MLVFDTETDGVNPLADHIVTATLMLMDPVSMQIQRQLSWLLNFGGQIPAAATAVHGISTADMHARGRADIGVALGEIYSIIRLECERNRQPLVAYNAQFDLTLLETERQRHRPDIAPLTFPPVLVMDPLVLWKQAVPRKRGGRKLTDAAAYFKIAFDATKAHDAAYDCWLTGQVCAKLLRRKALKDYTPLQLTVLQTQWKWRQAAELEAWFHANGKPTETVERQWPVIHRERVAA